MTLLAAAQALLAGVNQTFDKDAAVAVHFQAGVWPAFVEAVELEQASPAQAAALKQNEDLAKQVAQLQSDLDATKALLETATSKQPAPEPPPAPPPS